MIGLAAFEHSHRQRLRAELLRALHARARGSGWWKGLEPRQIVEFQLFTPLLCMPFADFHEAVEKALGRPVWWHEFAYEGLKKEFLNREPGS